MLIREWKSMNLSDIEALDNGLEPKKGKEREDWLTAAWWEARWSKLQATIAAFPAKPTGHEDDLTEK